MTWYNTNLLVNTSAGFVIALVCTVHNVKQLACLEVKRLIRIRQISEYSPIEILFRFDTAISFE